MLASVDKPEDINLANARGYVAAIIVPNLWLTLIGHTETNLLFLPLMVGWVAYVGTPAEGLVALFAAFGTITGSAAGRQGQFAFKYVF